MVKGETAWRGGAGGDDYHHEVTLGTSPTKNNLGASTLNSLNLNREMTALSNCSPIDATTASS